MVAAHGLRYLIIARLGFKQPRWAPGAHTAIQDAKKAMGMPLLRCPELADDGIIGKAMGVYAELLALLLS